MSAIVKQPSIRPHNARFSSGPCAKRPGWHFKNLETETIGRSHRSGVSAVQIKQVLDLSRKILQIPADFKIVLTPASDTGAMEMALWNFLGAPGIGVDVFGWEQFGLMWLNDITNELRLPDTRAFEAPYGMLPDLNMMEPNRDAVFTMNGTTSGVRMPDGPEPFPRGDRGLRICDATSGIFAHDMPWNRLDVVTWSWQKSMGGEAQHGMMALSPKAVQRLRDYRPSWPMPKILQLHTASGVNEALFEGSPLNTPSMICVADALDSLQWMDSIGGLNAMKARVAENARQLDEWVRQTPWVEYLAADSDIRSKTSVCLRLAGPDYAALNAGQQQKLVDGIVELLEEERVAYDIKSYKAAPLGLRIWCGATIEAADIRALTPWLDWAYHIILDEIRRS